MAAEMMGPASVANDKLLGTCAHAVHVCRGLTGVDRGVPGGRMVVTVDTGGRCYETLEETHSDKSSSGFSREPSSLVPAMQ